MGRKTRQNSITSPELLAQVNPENTALASDFIDYLKSTKKSQTTIAVYKNDLEIAFVWGLKFNNNKQFTDWTKREIVRFQNWLINDNGNGSARVRRIKATLSSLSNYIENILDDDYPNFRNIINKIENPVAQTVREKTVLTDEQVETALRLLVERKDYDKACMLALAACSGRRKAELVRFRVDDFKDENLVCDGALYKTSEPMKTKGRGEGKFIYCYTLAKKFKPYLDMWMEERKRRGIESEWLFPLSGDMTKQMDSDTLNSWARTIGSLINVDYYWHAMRHMFVTNLVRAGLPDGVIQEIVGWTSADMVRIYTDMDSEEQIGMWFKDGDICADKKKTL